MNKKSTAKRAGGLTKLERQFVDEYVYAPSGAEAARRAGYSVATARTKASQLLRKPFIRAAVDKLVAKDRAERKDRAEKARDELLNQLHDLALVTFSDFFDDGGNLLPVNKLGPTCSAAIRDYDKKAGTVVLLDRLKLLEMLCKSYGLFKDSGDITGGAGNNVHIHLPANGYETKPIEDVEKQLGAEDTAFVKGS